MDAKQVKAMFAAIDHTKQAERYRAEVAASAVERHQALEFYREDQKRRGELELQRIKNTGPIGPAVAMPARRRSRGPHP